MVAEVLNMLTVIHFLSMAGLAVYGLHRIWMIYSRKNLRLNQWGPLDMPDEDMPRVTVQVPLYNERLVAGRIIDAAASLDWPQEKFQIQVLDDSDDETRIVTVERAAYWNLKGRDITVIRRNNRMGYKAGALAAGLEQATGDYIAVFDADFIPRPDFLKQTMPYFTDKVGMVQARWGFLNAGCSWLTRLQALLLSAHFGIEHAVRFGRGLFFNFNGTAGVWRKSAIESAGGWQSDTVTEDLDLSYRAQLAGWRFVYLHHVEVPSELPVTITDFRCQQERWSKGAIQTARKLLPRLLSAPLPVAVKIEAMAHLLANFCWVFGLLAMLTLYPVLINRVGIGVYQVLWIDLPLFSLTGGAVLLYYYLYGWKSGLKQSLYVLPLLPAASIGLAPFFSLAVFKGLFRKGGIFTRTPKFGFLDDRQGMFISTSVRPHMVANLFTNLTLFIYTLMPVCFSMTRETWPAVPFLCLFPFGFLLMITCEMQECLPGFYKMIRSRL